MNPFYNFIFTIGRLAFAGLLIWFALQHAMNWSGQDKRAVDNQIVANALEDPANLEELSNAQNKVGVLNLFHTEFTKKSDEEKKAILGESTTAGPFPFGLKQFNKLDGWFKEGTSSLVSKIWPFILGGLALISLIGHKLTFTWIVRLVVGILLLYSGLMKITGANGIGDFASAIQGHGFGFSPEVANLLGTTIPYVEVLAGALFLLLAWRAHPANLLIITLLGFFAFAAGWVLLKDGNAVNSLLGLNPGPNTWTKFAAICALLLACLSVLVYRSARHSKQSKHRAYDPRNEDQWAGSERKA